jgi:DNA (cytosine-5)-methyltransferase 1
MTTNPARISCPETESNRRHGDFQSVAGTQDCREKCHVSRNGGLLMGARPARRPSRRRGRVVSRERGRGVAVSGLSIGSLFSGIGGLELGLERAGLGPVLWQCELDPFCRRVLAKHWPDVTRFEDVTQPRRWPHVDLVCGGFPCQDVSSAGKRRGIGGQRSGLWWYFAEVVRQVAPRFVVVENVASGTKRWLPHVRHALHLLGYGTRAVAVSAADVGAPHLRRRVFVVGDSHAHREPACAVNAEAPGMRPATGPLRDGWVPAPERLRMDDGLSSGLDRLRALGNAVVPQCAEVVGRMIQEMTP